MAVDHTLSYYEITNSMLHGECSSKFKGLLNW